MGYKHYYLYFYTFIKKYAKQKTFRMKINHIFFYFYKQRFVFPTDDYSGVKQSKCINKNYIYKLSILIFLRSSFFLPYFLSPMFLIIN